MSAAAGQKYVRKFPPPCWTRDEALVLIEAYRERWYALHRAFLRTPDWDAVAEKVTTTCPDVIPPKTSAQCRHKMEKLRQRHRAEKQRASAFSGERFFSTWFYFEAMESMENGSDTEPGNNHQISSQTHLNPGRGVRFKPSSVQTLATSSPKQSMKSNPNFVSRFSNRYASYPNHVSNDEDYEYESVVETLIEEDSIPTAYRGRHSKIHLVETPIREEKNTKSSLIGGGIRIKPSITPHQESNRPGLRPRKFSKIVRDEEDRDNGEMWTKIPRNLNWSRGKQDQKHQNEYNSIPNGNNSNTRKKNNRGISEMVSSIRFLGDGFMKVEKMKIDMAMEIEKMRMDSEMKRNQLILESQKQIVDAIVKGVMESTKQVTKLVHL